MNNGITGLASILTAIAIVFLMVAGAAKVADYAKRLELERRVEYSAFCDRD